MTQDAMYCTFGHDPILKCPNMQWTEQITNKKILGLRFSCGVVCVRREEATTTAISVNKKALYDFGTGIIFCIEYYPALYFVRGHNFLTPNTTF